MSLWHEMSMTYHDKSDKSVTFLPYSKRVLQDNILLEQLGVSKLTIDFLTTCRFIQEKNWGACDKFTGNQDLTLLTSRNRTCACKITSQTMTGWIAIQTLPVLPILESLIPRMPSSFIVSSVLNFFASKLMFLGNLKSVLYKTVS